MHSVTKFVIAVAFGLLLTGCGGGGPKRLSHDDYLAAVNRISASSAAQDAGRRFITLAAGFNCSGKPLACSRLSRTACSAGSKSFAGDIHEIIDAVARIHPPHDVEDLQQRFLTDSGHSADQLDRLADDVAAGRVACGRTWNLRAFNLPSTVAAEHVLDEFTKRYKLGTGEAD